MLTFSNIINPFKYPYPNIYSLPSTLFTLLESPVPILAGKTLINF